MIIHISKSSRKGILVVAVAVALMLSWSSIRSALAEHYSGLDTRNGYERATQLEPTNARYWYLLGRSLQHDMEDPDTTRAIQAYRTSLALDPQSANTWLDLASAFESEGDLNASRTAFLQANRVYPSSADVAWKYGNFLLRQNELEPAFSEIRHAVEADPKWGSQAFSVCLHVDPNLDAVMDRVLPPVPSIYLQIIWRLTDEDRTDLALRVWSRLVPLHPQPLKGDVLHFVDRLMGHGQLAEARHVWNQAVGFMGIPLPQDPPGSVVWDGGFETDMTNGGLGWHIQPPLGSYVQFDENVKHSGRRALRIDFDGTQNNDFRGVCQYVVIEPSAHYQLSAWLHSSNLTTDKGIFFRLTTLPAAEYQPHATSQILGTAPWTRVILAWDAPPDSRLLQLCVARAPSSEPKSKVAGTVWVDDVALVLLGPRPETTAKTQP